jgi:formiminoglutamase
MSDYLHLIDFLSPLNKATVSNNQLYQEGQIGKTVDIFEDSFPDIPAADIVLVGCNEYRGSGLLNKQRNAADAIREQFYQLYNWHKDIQVADIGNVINGASLQDSYAAVKTVVKELLAEKKTVLILGGSHDITIAQYEAYADFEQTIDITCVDALINIDTNSGLKSENFLMDLLTAEPNYVRHYNHIGFQSYFVHPHMLETMDKLRFDCFRLGHVKESVEEMEPVVRNCQLFSFDIAAIAHASAPANTVSPNGFSGEESCLLLRYAGMSPVTNTIGIYGYLPEDDKDHLTAKQISQMLWYVLDGRSRGKKEAALQQKDAFNAFHLAFSEVDTIFLQSKKTGRWWMQLPDKKYIACSYKDYLLASKNEIPERWLRAQERS